MWRSARTRGTPVWTRPLSSRRSNRPLCTWVTASAPSSSRQPVCCATLGGKNASELRSRLLRSGRVRAIARLVQGVLRSKPSETQALWMLGPSYADVGIAD